MDILLDTNEGKIDIEMNATIKDFLHIRNTAYLCDTYSHYTLVGEEYREEVKIIQINFTYGMGKTEKEIVRKYYIQDERGQKFVKNFLIMEYNMDKIMEIWYSKNKKEIEKYKYLIMLDLNLEELRELSEKDRLVEKYRMNVEIVNKDPRFRVYMTEEEDKRKIYNTEMRIARETGLKEGREEGKQQGIQQGIEQGREKGAFEEKRTIAKKLLKLGFNSLEQIKEATGLSLEILEKLQKEIEKI